MRVVKFTTRAGQTFFNADFGPQLVAETLKRLPNWKCVEMIEMTEQEYFSIPATNEAAALWSGPTPRAVDPPSAGS